MSAGMDPAIREAGLDDADALVELWDACGLIRPWNDPLFDIKRAIEGPSSAILVVDDSAGLAASVLVGDEGHRGWIYYLAVSPEHQKEGLGRKMVAAAEAWLMARNCPKLELLIRRGNDKVQGFYENLGYAVEDRIVMSRTLFQTTDYQGSRD